MTPQWKPHWLLMDLPFSHKSGLGHNRHAVLKQKDTTFPCLKAATAPFLLMWSNIRECLSETVFPNTADSCIFPNRLVFGFGFVSCLCSNARDKEHKYSLLVCQQPRPILKWLFSYQRKAWLMLKGAKLITFMSGQVSGSQTLWVENILKPL